MTNYPKLLSPIQIGGVEYPNRVVMAPMTRSRGGAEYKANDVMATYYSQRASAGLIITEGTHTSVVGRGWWGAPEIYTDEDVTAWRKVTDAVHAKGGRIVCQLWHLGRASHSSFRAGIPGFEGDKALAVAPSAIKRKSEKGKQMYTPLSDPPDIETPRALTIEEVKALPAEYINCAQKAKQAGFDGVEVHSANGYLLDEFLQTHSNTRTDEYGGSLENRFRLLGEILKGVFTVFDPSCVGVRLSPNGVFNGMGDENTRSSFLYYIEQLASYGLGYLHVMIGLGFGFHGHGEALTMADVRKVYPGVLIANVGYDAESAEKEIASGNTDMVAFGRPYISNPDLVERFASGGKLAPPAEYSAFYGTVDYDPGAVGYTDYPTMSITTAS